jgi:hypothetical protein
MVYQPWSDPDGVAAAKDEFGDEILVGAVCGNGIWSIENITDWTGIIYLPNDIIAVQNKSY